METDIEIQAEQSFHRHALSCIKQNFGVEADKICFVGKSDNHRRWWCVCTSCLRRRPLPAPKEGQEMAVPTDRGLVEMRAMQRVLHDFSGRIYWVLAGQCPDCGDVYYARHTQVLIENLCRGSAVPSDVKRR